MPSACLGLSTASLEAKWRAEGEEAPAPLEGRPGKVRKANGAHLRLADHGNGDHKHEKVAGL
jgi:hypothetical protein